MHNRTKWKIRITNLCSLTVTTVDCRDGRTARLLAEAANLAARGRYLHEAIKTKA